MLLSHLVTTTWRLQPHVSGELAFNMNI